MSVAAEYEPWNKMRVEALSDAVFAIVMTLIVLELKVPALPRHAAPSELWHGLRELGPTFFSYFLTFALSGKFWLFHHRCFHELAEMDRGLFGINLLFLSFVSLLPFSTALLGSFSLSHPVSQAFYFGNLFVLGLALNALWVYAKRRGLLRPAEDSSVRRRYSIAIVGDPLAALAALAMLPFAPGRAMQIYALAMLAVGVLVRRWSRRVAGRPAAAV